MEALMECFYFQWLAVGVGATGARWCGWLHHHSTRVARKTQMCWLSHRTSPLTQGILVQERQHQGAMLLSSSSASLTAFLHHCEGCYERIANHLNMDNVGQQLRQAIANNTPRLQCCHPADAAAAIIPLFLRIRLHHACKLLTQNVRLERQKKRHESKFRKLNAM